MTFKTMMAVQKDSFSSFARTPKSQAAAEQQLTGECWISSKKDTPYPKAKEKTQQDSRRD